MLILGLTVLILFIDLYGKLLVSQYLSGSEKEKKVALSTPKHKVEETSPQALSHLLGSDPETILSTFGEPARIEPSSYNYDWWVYNQDPSHYMQLGILQNKVVTIYAGGKDSNVSPFYIGQKYVDIYALAPFSYEVALEYGKGSYQFELSETEINEQPLISLEHGWAQLYFDKFTHQLMGVRYMDDETLLKLRPYQLIYSGDLVTPGALDANQQKLVEEASAKQVLDLTNVVRAQHGLPLLSWNEGAAQVAYLHSKDMKEANYFSHVSPTAGTLGDRLARGSVTFKMAGENIASNYNDSIAAVHGWLNSEGHRKNILNEQFTGLGVGIFEKYYTQNFVQK